MNHSDDEPVVARRLADLVRRRSGASVGPTTGAPDPSRSSSAGPVDTVGVLRRAAARYGPGHHLPEQPVRWRWGLSRRLAVALLGALVAVVCVVSLRDWGPPTAGTVTVPTPRPMITASGTAKAVVVHVVGAVVAPGVVRLSNGARVVDAIAAAGGCTEDADLSAINLARTVTDGEQIAVLTPGQVPPVPVDSTSGLVNLNTASAAELEDLPGIGPVLAERIMQARPFGSVDDLDKVSGIGPSVMGQLRDRVTV